jgi:hypothetical protein
MENVVISFCNRYGTSENYMIHTAEVFIKKMIYNFIYQNFKYPEQCKNEGIPIKICLNVALDVLKEEVIPDVDNVFIVIGNYNSNHPVSVIDYRSLGYDIVVVNIFSFRILL